jgi:hypothetical protein
MIRTPRILSSNLLRHSKIGISCAIVDRREPDQAREAKFFLEEEAQSSSAA